MIIETSSNELYSVRETGDINLSHVWLGQRVKRTAQGYVPVKKLRTEMVRKAASKIVQA